MRVIITLKAAYQLAVSYNSFILAQLKGRARKRRLKQTRGRLLFNHGLGSRVHTRTLDADLVEGGVVTGGGPTTPRDTWEQGDTNTQYNRQTTALRT